MENEWTMDTDLSLPSSAAAASTAGLLRAWIDPGRSCRPHTRWWWLGNALEKSDITFQMEAMAAAGMGGVEIMHTWKCFGKGNHEFFSEGFFGLVGHVLDEAKRLDMEVSFTFSPGWSFGGSWVPREDQSRSLVRLHKDIRGPAAIPDALAPLKEAKGLPGELDALVSVSVARIRDDGSLDPESLAVLPVRDREAVLPWTVGDGRWRIMAFCLVLTGQVCQANSFHPPPKVIDHMNREAVRRYCEHLGGAYFDRFGERFGSTVESMFCDSFEVATVPGGVMWSVDTLDRARTLLGYDIEPYLGAIWDEMPPLTPHIRYDINRCLHEIGLDSLFRTFGDWCAAHGTQARIQPHYRFPTEIVQASGSVVRPETEVTTRKFATVADPRKATVSGCRFYGMSHVSAEAYTFIHRHRYITTLAEMKAASDAFFRDGVTQFYNHGYLGTPETRVDPHRDFPWASHLNHQNPWWPHYRHLAAYVARCCALLRQGDPVTDILLYSPQADTWTGKVLFGGERRVMQYGTLPRFLIEHGYDYEIVNDHLLQEVADIGAGRITIRGFAFRILLLPSVRSMPLETLEAVARFAEGGGLVVALGDRPEACPGLADREERNRSFRSLVRRMFEDPGLPSVRWLPDYDLEPFFFDPSDQEEAPPVVLDTHRQALLDLLHGWAEPDVSFGDGTGSPGVAFLHRTLPGIDLYFVTNLSARRFDGVLGFRTGGRSLQRWDAMSGAMEPMGLRRDGPCARVALGLDEWQSAFLVFADADPAGPTAHENPAEPAAAPEPAGPGTGGRVLDLESWIVELKRKAGGPLRFRMDRLASLSDRPDTKHISGDIVYTCQVDLAEGDLQAGGILLDLGGVSVAARLEVNGRFVRDLWMPPYRASIRDFLAPGTNEIRVTVSNLLMNEIAGLRRETPIEPSLRSRLGRKGILAETLRKTKDLRVLDILQAEIRKRPWCLPPSGLLGPVRLVVGNRPKAAVSADMPGGETKDGP